LTELFVEWEIFQTKRCRENQNTHLVFHNVCPKIVPFYEIMWKYTVELYRPRIQYTADALCKLDN